MGTPLWTLGDLRDAVGGTTQADDRNILGVSIDSRTVQPGEAFIALKGPQFDGHAYIPQALKAGAAACVVSDASLIQSLPADTPLILVPDTSETELMFVAETLRSSILEDAERVASYLRDHRHCEKVNMAALGNQVPQLHVHLVGRREGDACWPMPIWGHLEASSEWTEAQVSDVRRSLIGG